MVKQKIIVEQTNIPAHTWKCPKCDKVIIGSKPQEVAFNAGLHLDSHKERKQ